MLAVVMFISGLLDVTLTLTNIVTEGMRGIDNDNDNGNVNAMCGWGQRQYIILVRHIYTHSDVHMNSWYFNRVSINISGP